MRIQDEIGVVNEQHWERMVEEGCGFTRPWLNLDRALIRQYAQGQLDPVPAPLIEMYPANVLADVEGKEVLCLASGGGQQSAVFGLLGAHVTVVDLGEGQLEGDRTAAPHYGYEVTTIRADMRDLSCIGNGSFTIVYQAPSMAYIPNVWQVYAEVARVLELMGCTECVSPIQPRSLWTGIPGMERVIELLYPMLRELRGPREMGRRAPFSSDITWPTSSTGLLPWGCLFSRFRMIPSTMYGRMHRLNREAGRTG